MYSRHIFFNFAFWKKKSSHRDLDSKFHARAPVMQRVGMSAGYICLAEGVLKKRGRVFWHLRTCRLISARTCARVTYTLDLCFSNATTWCFLWAEEFPISRHARVRTRSRLKLSSRLWFRASEAVDCAESGGRRVLTCGIMRLRW